MIKNKFLNSISLYFHIYKSSSTVFLFGLYAVLSILGNKFGIVYLVLAFFPILAWGILSGNERRKNDL